MLTLTLRNLERDGLVNRTVYPTVPVRVDCELTDLGRTLVTPIMALHEWAVAHREDIRRARPPRPAGSLTVSVRTRPAA